MNSDPNESAAWRTFGMLDADEAAGFDEALRHDPDLKSACREMDCLAAAVAAASATPIAPRAGQLERLHMKLGLNAAKRTNWLGISGWAAAAAVTLILVVDRQANHSPATATNTPPASTIPDPKKSATLAGQTVGGVENPGIPGESDPGNTAKNIPLAASPDGDGKAIVKVETKRLIQEIEVLRGKLENFQERDRARFQTVAGMAWPVVMRMGPPGNFSETSNGLIAKNDDPTITDMLGDGLIAANGNTMTNTLTPRLAEMTAPTAQPSAIPIYDAARDAGTLVVSNLPPAGTGESYNLWVTTKTGANPVYVGRLPESDSPGAESFDFSLGSTATVPSSFILTRDRQGEPMTPSDQNIFLKGPR